MYRYMYNMACLSLYKAGMLAKRIFLCEGPNQCSGEGPVGFTAAPLVSMVALVCSTVWLKFCIGGS